MGRLILLVGVAGCASPPVVELGFAEASAGDACLGDESQWFTDLERVWISAENEDGPIEHGCVSASDIGGWDALESRLRSKGDLLTDMPVGPSFHLYLLAVELDAGCPGPDGPTSPFDFCAFTVDPVTIPAEGTVSAPLTRYCQNRIDKDACYAFAENRRR